MRIIALGEATRPGKVTILAEELDSDKDTLYFRCINGNWEGTYSKGIMTNRANSHPMVVVYQGELPNPLGFSDTINYNVVIARIEQEIAAK